jgi:hypothetical protein
MAAATGGAMPASALQSLSFAAFFALVIYASFGGGL